MKDIKIIKKLLTTNLLFLDADIKWFAYLKRKKYNLVIISHNQIKKKEKSNVLKEIQLCWERYIQCRAFPSNITKLYWHILNICKISFAQNSWRGGILSLTKFLFSSYVYCDDLSYFKTFYSICIRYKHRVEYPLHSQNLTCN